MNKTLIISFLLLCFSLTNYSQTTTLNYNTPFQTTNQNLWKQGSAGIVQIDQIFFDKSFNVGPNTVGGVSSVAGFDFGAEVTYGLWAEIGSGFQLNFGTEQVDIDYNAIQNIVRPNDFAFDAGDKINLATSFNPLATSDMVTDTYDINMRLWLKYGMGIELSTKICVFSCADIDILDLQMPVDTFDIVRAGSTTGISLLDGWKEWPVEDAFPFHYEDPEGIITVDITLPSNAGANVYLHNKELHSFVDPSNPYFNAYFSIPKFIGILNIPYVSAFFANASNSYEAGPFYLDYTLLETGFNLGLYHKQHLILDPTMKGKFEIQTPVDYQIVNPLNGAVLSQGYDSIINYTVGNDVKIDFPCYYDYLDVTPSFEMENTFTNHTYDSIALDFVFQMLEFHIGMEDVTVIPAFCVDVPYPCPTWSNPFKWCSEEVCTPAVVFDGFEYGFGPLVDWQPNLFNVKYDWCNNNWSMEGFNSFPDMETFRLEPRKFDVQMAVQPVKCANENTGSATVTVTNGSPPYTYEWSNGTIETSSSTTNTQTNLPAGTYYVIVRDANECSVFASEVIVEPLEPLEIDVDIVSPLCYDSNDGSINISTSGGTPNYTYNWSNGATTESLNNIDAGVYTVNIFDNNGCPLSETFTISKPDSLSITYNTSDIACKGENTGNLNIDVEGGVAPYSYLWSNGDTTNIGTDLVAGIYDITITDFNSCQKTQSIIINEPALELTENTTVTDVACYNDSTGMIDVTAIGGNAPYFYTWYNASNFIINQSTPQLVNMPDGDYRLILSDSLGCTDTVDYTINQPDSLFYEFDVVDNRCYGQAQGEVTLSLSGATPAYSYLWSNGATTNHLTGLLAGTYTLTVTDFNQCEKELSVFVDQPSTPISVTTEITDVACYGGATGGIAIEPIGGTAPYTFLWSNGFEGQNLINVPIGTYTVAVTDTNNCVYYSGGVVAQPDEPITINYEIVPISCFGYNDGSVTIDISGGTIPYKLRWDDTVYVISSNQQILSNLHNKNYNITIIDANNCVQNQLFFVESPDSVIIELEPTIVSCFNGSDGTIISTIEGGTPPFSYLWNNGGTQSELSGIPVGIYTLSITDAEECTYTAQTEVFSFPEIKIKSEIIPPSCRDLDDAYILLSVEGGTENYTFAWSNGQTKQSATDLASGNYEVVVYDDNDCQVSQDFQVPYVYEGCVEIPSTFSPNNDDINDVWNILNINEYPNLLVQVYNVWGNLVYENRNEYVPWDGTYHNNPLPSGTYYYIINLNNGDDAPFTGTVTIVR